MSKVLITGGTGLIGMSLSQTLAESGFSVVHLSRNPKGNEEFQTFQWNIDKGEIDPLAFQNVEHIIHLAGASVADGKWTEERKTVLIDSRVKSAKLLKRYCIQENIQLKHFISASAIGWYPMEINDQLYTEDEAVSSGYLADICKVWEAAADTFQEIAEHVAKIRIGVVMSKNGGALTEISRPIRLYVGAGLGSGRQAMNWIHIDDVAGIFKHVLQNRLSGIFNAVGPTPTTNQDFMQTLADVLDRPILLPNVPEFVMRLILGASSEMVLKGTFVSAEKIIDSGYEFDFPTINSALFDIYWAKNS